MRHRVLSAGMLGLLLWGCMPPGQPKWGPPRLRGHFTIVASRKLENFAETTGFTKVTGKSCRSAIHYLMLGVADDRVIERAVEDALSKAPSSNALILAKIEFSESGGACVTVTGLPVSRP